MSLVEGQQPLLTDGMEIPATTTAQTGFDGVASTPAGEASCSSSFNDETGFCPGPEGWRKHWFGITVRVCVLLAIVVGIVCAFAIGDLHSRVDDLLVWIDEHRALGSLVFLALASILEVVCFPASLLTLSAGAVFGIPLGLLLAWTAANVSLNISFVLGRFVLYSWVEKRMRRYNYWTAIQEAIKEEGFKMMILMRLSPVLPYGGVNYGMAVTDISHKIFALGSAVGIIPGALLYVYIGSLASDLSSIINGDTGIDRNVAIALYAVGGVLTVLLVVLLTRSARKAIRKRLITTGSDMGGDRTSGVSGDAVFTGVEALPSEEADMELQPRFGGNMRSRCKDRPQGEGGGGADKQHVPAGACAEERLDEATACTKDDSARAPEHAGAV